MNASLQPTTATGRYFKVLSDGSRVPSGDPRTDHVAVHDTARNLLFYPHSIAVKGKPAPLKKLLAEIAKIDALGGGWRMATRVEAESILDLSRHGPAVDPALFPGIGPAWHITSTPAAWAPASHAWWVYFYFGNVYDGGVDNVGFAVAVRPAGQ